MPTSAADLLDLLIEENIVTIQADESIREEEGFRELIEETRADLADGTLESDVALVDSIDDSEFLVRYCALSSVIDNFTTGELAHLTLVLEQIANGFPPGDGSPAGFLPIRGDQVDTALAIWPHSIVYIWLEDCDPCELVKQDLDELVPNGDPNLGLFSIYGPGCPEMLYREFSVRGGPALLFTLDGAVDSRLMGAHPTAVVQREIEMLRDLSQ